MGMRLLSSVAVLIVLDQGVCVFLVPTFEMDNRRTKQLHIHDNGVKILPVLITRPIFRISASNNSITANNGFKVAKNGQYLLYFDLHLFR
jgi:hypothetical protein